MEKEFSANTILPGDAFHDQAVKRGVIVGEAIRTIRISDEVESDLNKLEVKLTNNRYGKYLIKEGIQSAKKKVAENKNKNIEDTKERKPKLITSYMGKTSKRLRKKLRNLNVKLISRKRTNLEGRLASTFKYSTDNGKGIIYQINCQCGEAYVGETAFDFKKRKSEHIRDIKTNSQSNALNLHIQETGHELSWNNCLTLGREQDQDKRKIKESLFIQKIQPTINISKGKIIKGNWDL